MGELPVITFWESPTGEVLAFVVSVLAAIGVAAGGLKGIQFFWRQARATGKHGLNRLHEHQRREAVLESLTSTANWPNGSNSLKGTLQTLYDNQGRQKEQIETVQVSLDNLTQQLERLLIGGGG